MKWVFNQKCQLIIEEWDVESEYENVFEFIVHRSSGKFGTFHNRTSTKQVVDIELDGVYDVYVIKTNHPINILEKKLNDTWKSFNEWLNSTEGKIFELEGPIEHIVSICNLRKCVLEQERVSIEEFLSMCNKKGCATKSSNRNVRDILLISIFVLESLICKGKFSEVESILESLSSCGTICNNPTNTCCNG